MIGRGPSPRVPSPRALRGETGVRGVREACPPGAAIPRVRSLAGRWAEGGGARPRGSAGMRGREGGARPRNGQARQPMGSRSFEIRPIAARGRAYLPVGGAGAHPGAADSGLVIFSVLLGVLGLQGIMRCKEASTGVRVYESPWRAAALVLEIAAAEATLVICLVLGCSRFWGHLRSRDPTCLGFHCLLSRCPELDLDTLV